MFVWRELASYLGAAMACKASFLQSFMQDKVDAWVCENKTLSKVTLDQPHAAYICSLHL